MTKKKTRKREREEKTKKWYGPYVYITEWIADWKKIQRDICFIYQSKEENSPNSMKSISCQIFDRFFCSMNKNSFLYEIVAALTNK